MSGARLGLRANRVIELQYYHKSSGEACLFRHTNDVQVYFYQNTSILVHDPLQ